MDIDFHSDDGQDEWVLDVLDLNRVGWDGSSTAGRKQNGYFVDISASDDIAHSNTYTLEKDFGWAGIRVGVPAITLLQLLNKHNAPVVVDYLSIDTEGAEWEILRDFDFSKYTFLTITVEHNYFSRNILQWRRLPKEHKINCKFRRDNIRALLSEHGYVLVKELEFGEDWFVHKSIT